MGAPKNVANCVWGVRGGSPRVRQVGGEAGYGVPMAAGVRGVAAGARMLTVRPATGDDSAYVMDSFVHEFGASVYADGLGRGRVRRLMLDCWGAGFAPSVLYESDTPDEIIAWCMHRHDAVAWVHVKGIYRRHGMAKELLGRLGIAKGKILTPFVPSPAFAREARRHGWNLCHRPWIGSC